MVRHPPPPCRMKTYSAQFDWKAMCQHTRYRKRDSKKMIRDGERLLEKIEIFRQDFLEFCRFVRENLVKRMI